ncbi:unnamed protein product [Clonostachys rosea f. rosea IK726]|uniref:Uncharacterized protein n=1 Tax=Clonostachys rosea f. rosea IK726 TaxID=1349383 RepID=A0ACA9UAC6_BIOOC|nr:unnamed protein product [Clonostachys rosea f. rosea IK726]
MTMTMDAQQRFGPTMNLEYPHHSQAPTFSNPWSSSSSTSQPAPSSGLFGASQQPPPLNPNLMAGKPPPGRAGSSLGSYATMPVTTSADLLGMNRLPTTAPYADASYTTSAGPVAGQFPTSSAPYDALGYAPAPVRPTQFSLSLMRIANTRACSSNTQTSPRNAGHEPRDPRNIYGSRNDRSSVDSYGFPSTHSTSSSISSASNFSSYYGDSVSDYSTAGSDVEQVNSRTLPRPHGLMHSQMPPAPQSMMSQFSSKVSSSTQKKHKCKVCEKRFTRPSSLQTHMYSHTGEKPFACEVEGCGRHFSVVSNLRRHRKVHRGDARSEAGSEDHQSD